MKLVHPAPWALGEWGGLNGRERMTLAGRSRVHRTAGGRDPPDGNAPSGAVEGRPGPPVSAKRRLSRAKAVVSPTPANSQPAKVAPLMRITPGTKTAQRRSTVFWIGRREDCA